jgi:hypothetical protein
MAGDAGCGAGGVGLDLLQLIGFWSGYHKNFPVGSIKLNKYQNTTFWKSK